MHDRGSIPDWLLDEVALSLGGVVWWLQSGVVFAVERSGRRALSGQQAHSA